VIPALETMGGLLSANEIELSKGIQSQLRVLAQDFNNDIAEIAEEILEKLA
jgi:hypothetical protein